MPFLERRSDFLHHGKRRRNGGDPDMAGKALARRAHLLAHRAAVADDATGPFQHALSLGRQSLKARTAANKHHAKLVLQLADGRRQGGLRHATFFRGAAKMLLIRQCYEEFQLVDHPALPRRKS